MENFFGSSSSSEKSDSESESALIFLAFFEAEALEAWLEVDFRLSFSDLSLDLSRCFLDSDEISLLLEE